MHRIELLFCFKKNFMVERVICGNQGLQGLTCPQYAAGGLKTQLCRSSDNLFFPLYHFSMLVSLGSGFLDVI